MPYSLQKSAQLLAALGLLLALQVTASAPAYPQDIQETGRNSFVYQPLSPEPNFPKLSSEIRRNLERQHFEKLKLNDDLSERILDNFLFRLDREKSILLMAHVDNFTEKYKYQLDDFIRSGNLNEVFTIFNLFRSRALARIDSELEELEKKLAAFDFNLDEELLADRELAEWQESEEALNDLWRRMLKNQMLSLQLEGKEKEKIVEIIGDRLRDRRLQLRRMRPIDAFSLFINSYTELYDSHTNYMSPTNAENFNIDMRLSLEGIGAVLRQNKEYVQVVDITPGGPAKKQGELKPNSNIIAVAQGDAEFEDIIGWRLVDVIQKIRGPRGSVVRLKVLPPGENDLEKFIIIAIKRDRVKLEKQAAKKKVLTIEHDNIERKVGVISFRSFYLDFKGRDRREKNYRSTTRDVLKLLKELEPENIDGLIIDLRNNGGGSLQEANALVGLFIEAGATVQVKRSSGQIIRQGKINRTPYYTKPLAVLINRYSASASEIFSGAIQDYNRGIIIGGQSFGKGTVQSLLPLTAGQMKITDAKFYRISGASTQLKGVTPDIVYPPMVDAESVGEETLKHAMPWDRIIGTRMRLYNNYDIVLPQLQKRHEQRIADNSEFNFLKKRYLYWQEADENNKWVSLNEAERKRKQQEDKQRIDDLKAIRAGETTGSVTTDSDKDQITAAAVTESAESKREVNEESSTLTSTANQPAENLSAVSSVSSATQTAEKAEKDKDPLLTEAAHILLDSIVLLAQTKPSVFPPKSFRQKPRR